MTTTFWSNTIWFIILGITTIVEMVIVLNKTSNRKHVISLFFIVSGMAFSIEVIICCFLKAYEYYPMIIPQSPIDDNLAGNLFSQFSITATAAFIAVFNLKYFWFLIFAGVYGLIEKVFLVLGIYCHNWYQTWITVAGLIFIFGITKKMYNSSLVYLGGIWRYIFMSFGLFTLHMPTVYWIQILTGIIMPNKKILSDAMSSYALISLLNLLLVSIVCMLVYFLKIKWRWKSIGTLALYGILYFAYKANLIYVKEGWFLIFATIDVLGMYLSIFILDKLMIE